MNNYKSTTSVNFSLKEIILEVIVSSKLQQEKEKEIKNWECFNPKKLGIWTSLSHITKLKIQTMQIKH